MRELNQTQSHTDRTKKWRRKKLVVLGITDKERELKAILMEKFRVNVKREFILVIYTW